MKEFKLVRLGWDEPIRKDIRTVAQYPVVSQNGYSTTMDVFEYPTVDKVVNSYLAQGWEIREILEKHDSILIQFIRER